MSIDGEKVIKDVLSKNYSDLSDHIEDEVANKISDKIKEKKDAFLSKVRGEELPDDKKSDELSDDEIFLDTDDEDVEDEIKGD